MYNKDYKFYNSQNYLTRSSVINPYKINNFDGISSFTQKYVSHESLYQQLKIAAEDRNCPEYLRLLRKEPDMNIINSEFKRAVYNDNLDLIKHLVQSGLLNYLSMSYINEGLIIAIEHNYNNIVRYFWLP